MTLPFTTFIDEVLDSHFVFTDLEGDVNRKRTAFYLPNRLKDSGIGSASRSTDSALSCGLTAFSQPAESGSA